MTRDTGRRQRPSQWPEVIFSVRAPVGPRLPRPGRGLLRRQGRRRRRRHEPHVPRLGRADAPACQRARRPRPAARRPRLVHHLQHPPAARGLLRRARGGHGPQPDQHPAHAARDRLHPRPRRVEGGVLPPRLHAAGRGDPAPALDAPASSWSWRASAAASADHEYEALLGGASTEPRHPQVDENAHRGAVLHERHDRPAQGRRAQPAQALPPRAQRRDRAALRRGRRGPARGPAVPRQRLGRAALRDA